MPNHYYLLFPPDSFVRKTEKAQCFHLNGQDTWIPTSQIMHMNVTADHIEITLPAWLVEQKALQDLSDPTWVAAGMPD